MIIELAVFCFFFVNMLDEFYSGLIMIIEFCFKKILAVVYGVFDKAPKYRGGCNSLLQILNRFISSSLIT